MTKRGRATYMSGMSETEPPRLYLDYHATTPTDPRVVETMMPFFTERFGNPHSAQHGWGWDAEAAVETARAQVAALIGAEPREVIFTSGATEANNLAIKGAARFWKGRKSRIVTCATEHKCVVESARAMEAEGCEVVWVPVGGDGLVDMAALDAAVTEDTIVVSIMAANNEIGVIQPVAEIGALCRERGAYFHTDAAQAAGKIPLDVQAMSIDLMSISGHKLYGPKGVGVLYVRRRPRARIEPLFSGGGQERTLRSGTLPTPLCVGLGAACAIAAEEMDAEAGRLRALRSRMMERLEADIEGMTLNGALEPRLPGNLNLSFAGVDGAALIEALAPIGVSSGSACTSAEVEPSYVLRAMGVPDELAAASIRVGLGRFTTDAEVDEAADFIAGTVARMRSAKGAQAAE